LEADLDHDDDYVTVDKEWCEDATYFKTKMARYLEDLEDVESHIWELKEKVNQSEDQLARSQDYDDLCGGKQAHYRSPLRYRLVMDSPLTPLPQEGRVVSVSQPTNTYASVLQVPPQRHVQRSITILHLGGMCVTMIS
jgi:hypothetical protein